MSKYQYELLDAINGTLADVISGASKYEATGVWRVTVDSENLIDALNRRLAAIDGTLPLVRRISNTVTTYEIANSAYLKLKESLTLG